MAKTENGFVRRIKELRANTGLKGEDFGKLFGVTKVAVHSWETGHNYPNQEVLFKICDYFNCSLDYLLGRTDIKNSIKDIISDDFTIKINQLAELLSDDEKKIVLKIAMSFSCSNDLTRKKYNT